MTTYLYNDLRSDLWGGCLRDPACDYDLNVMLYAN